MAETPALKRRKKTVEKPAEPAPEPQGSHLVRVNDEYAVRVTCA
jgi:hypothetical protein